MKSWESGMAVCEVAEPGVASAHAHSSEPLVCGECSEFACDFHGDRSPVDEDWLCVDCAAAERHRLTTCGDPQEPAA